MYAKIFASIYQGTLRGNTNGLVVFTNMLAHADSAGWVDIHPRAISEETGLPIEKVREAIAELSAPDPESRSPEEEGRRIVLLDDHRDWGWRVVNHGKYRAIKSEEDRRIANREYQQRHRDKLKASAGVSDHKHPLAQSAHTEAEAEAEAEADTNTKNTHRAKAQCRRFRRESCARFARPEYPVDCRLAPSPQGQEGTVDEDRAGRHRGQGKECRIDTGRGDCTLCQELMGGVRMHRGLSQSRTVAQQRTQGSTIFQRWTTRKG